MFTKYHLAFQQVQIQVFLELQIKESLFMMKLANGNKVMHIAVQISNEEALPLEDKFEKGKESNYVEAILA